MPSTAELKTESLFANVSRSEKAQAERLRQSRGLDSTATLIRSLVRDAATDTPEMSVGEYVRLHYWATRAPTTEAQRKDDLAMFERAVAPLTRAVAGVTTTSDAGLVPTSILGPVVSFADRARNLVRASNGFTGPLPMPTGGKTFTRPRMTQRISMAAQTELTEAASQAMNIAGDTVTKQWFASTLNVSEQDIDWTDPGVIQIVFNDMATAYGEKCDVAMATEIMGKITHGVNDAATSLTATATVFLAAVAAAAEQVYATSLAKPNAVLCALDRWQYIVSLVDTNGQPIFPQPDIAGPLGMALIPSPALTTGFVCVAAMEYTESYEELRGAISSAAPVPVPQPGNMAPLVSLLSHQLAWRGQFAAYVRPEALSALTELGADAIWGADLI